MTLETLVLIAGLFHFCLLPASLAVPKVLDWKREMNLLQPLSRRIVWVHGAFIAGTIIAFGLMTLLDWREMAAGGHAMLTGFMGLFWLARLGVQFFYYDTTEWPKMWWVRLGRYGLTALFAY